MTRSKKTGGRARRQPKNIRLIVVTGIPATGKTTVGDELQRAHGFRHLDFEVMRTLMRYVKRGVDIDATAIEKLKQEGRDVAITWGFVPDSQLPAVLRLRDLGFEWIWLDGNRDIARAKYKSLGRAMTDWDRQLAKIERFIDPSLQKLHPVTLDPFAPHGSRRPIHEVVADVLLAGRQ